jgi:archaellum biogenesis ATPase FlaH
MVIKVTATKVTNPTVANNSAAKKILPKTKTLNNRVNLILEVMNYLAQDRVQYVNANTEAINKLNKNVNGKLETLRKSYNLLNSDNAIVTTQKEAIRYTTEKNNYTSNQIAAWAALNVVALGTIFYVYRS